MKKKNFIIALIFGLIFIQCQEKKSSSKNAVVFKGGITPERAEKLKQMIPKLIEIKSLSEKQNEDFSPNYLSWQIANMKLLSFESNQDINLFNGNYVRYVHFNPLIDGHINRIILNINYPWMDTEIDLKQGKTYHIIVSGLASTSNCKTALWIGPEGKSDLLNNLPYYSVIGRIDNGESFFIGKETEIKPDKNGKLYLGYNDDLYVDNIGYYVVDIFELTKDETLMRMKAKNISIGSYYVE
jgi:hypothetical protein